MNKNEARVLIVDDFEMVRVLLRNILIKLGYQKIDEADTGRKALDMLTKAQSDKSPYSIVFSDWNMPEMTGYELLTECRAKSEFKNMPFVMVTAEGEEESVLKALEAGANEYLIKPISPDTLERKVNRIFAHIDGMVA